MSHLPLNGKIMPPTGINYLASVFYFKQGSLKCSQVKMPKVLRLHFQSSQSVSELRFEVQSLQRFDREDRMDG